MPRSFSFSKVQTPKSKLTSKEASSSPSPSRHPPHRRPSPHLEFSTSHRAHIEAITINRELPSTEILRDSSSKMRLKSHLSSLPPHLHPLLPLLSSIQIAQSQTLLFTPSTEIFYLLPPDSGFTLKDIEKLQRSVAKIESPPFQKGGVLLENERKMSLKKKRMWAGVGEKGLDGLLDGVGEGVGGGVVEISGEGGTKSVSSTSLLPF